MPCGLLPILLGSPTSRIAASAGPQSGSGRGLAAPVGSGRASIRLSPGFHPFRSFLRNIAVPSVLPVSDRQSGQQFRLGPGSRFLRPKAPVPPDNFRKVGSALALKPLPRASSSGRPAASSAAFILANFSHVRRGVCDFRFRPFPVVRFRLPIESVTAFRVAQSGIHLWITCISGISPELLRRRGIPEELE